MGQVADASEWVKEPYSLKLCLEEFIVLVRWYLNSDLSLSFVKYHSLEG